MNMAELCVRAAHSEEWEIGGELILETLYGFGAYLMGLGDQVRAAQALGKYFHLKYNRFSHQVSYFAELNGSLAGLLLAFPGREFAARNLATAMQMLRVYSPKEVCEYVKRAFILRDEEEVSKNEFFIAHLAVDSQFRRRGVGRALLAHAQKLAAERGLRKLALMVEDENHGAQKLYRQVGFVVVKTYSHPHQMQFTGSPGYVKMIKDI